MVKSTTILLIWLIAEPCKSEVARNCSTNSLPQKFLPGTMIEGKTRLGLEGVRGISNSIGYSVIDSVQNVQANTPTDEACKVQMAKIINRYGVPVSASSGGAQAAVRGTNFDDVTQQSCTGFGLCANIWDGNDRDVYPASTLTYVVVPTKISKGECSKMRVVYDYIKWILTSSQANTIATSEGFATMPKKVGELAVKQILDVMICEDDQGGHFVKDEPVPSQALLVKGSGSSLQEVLQGEMLHSYTGSGINCVARVVYDGSLGSGGGLCQLTVGSSSCWFNKTSRETVACALFDASKTTCLKAAPLGARTSFAGSDSILEMKSLTVQRQAQRMIPVFAAAIGLIHNLPIPDLVLSRQVVNAIFLGYIVRWDDPALLSTNPLALLPDRQIIRVVRADKSGTTEAFTRALASFANDNYTWGRTGYWTHHPLQGSSLPSWPAASTAGLTADQCVLEHCSRAVCAVGQWHDPVTDACQPCPPGTHQDARGQEPACRPCAAGSYSDAAGAALCAKCGEAWYQNASGQTACLRCPANTRRFLAEFADPPANSSAVEAARRGAAASAGGVTYRYEESPGTDVGECKCLAGFWLPSAMDNRTRPPLDGAESPYVDLTAGYATAKGGEACEPCPDGASCAGFQHNLQTIPYTREGYWGDPSFPGVFYECKSAKTCYKGYHCGKGHMGAMCAEPLQGYFTVGHMWYFQCPAGQGSPAAAALTVLVTAAVVYVWLQIMSLAEGSVYDSLDVGVKFLHLVGFMAQFPLRWHPQLDVVFLVLLVANLEVDFISPHCVWPGFTSVTLFYFQLLVPFVIVGVATAYWAAVTRRPSSRRLTIDDAVAEPLLNKMRIRDGSVVSTDAATYLISMSLQVFGFMYQVLAFRCFSVFTCRPHPRRDFLKFYPDLECGSAEHQTMTGVAMVYAIVVLFAGPFAVLYMLLWARKSNQLTSPAFSLRFGACYEQFKVDYVWWEVAVIARKLCISLILALISVPMIQGGLAVLLIYASIIAHVAARPFQEERNNLLETVCLFCALAFVCCGMIFYPSLSSSLDCVGTEVEVDACSGSMSIKEYFSVGLMVLVVLTFLLTVLSSLHEMYERYLAKLSADRIEAVRKWFLSQDRSDKKRNRRSSLRHGRLNLDEVRRSIAGLGGRLSINSGLASAASGIRRSFSLGPQSPAPESPGQRGLGGDSDTWTSAGTWQWGAKLERQLSLERQPSVDADSSLDVSADPMSPRLPPLAPMAPAEEAVTVAGSRLRLHLSHMLDGYYLSNWRLWLKEMERQDQNIRDKYRCGNPLSQLHGQEQAFLSVDDALPACTCRTLKSLGAVSNSSMATHCRALLEAFPGIIDYLCTAEKEARRGLFYFLRDYLTYIKVRPTFRRAGFAGEMQCWMCPQMEGREAVVQEEYASVVLDWLMHAPAPQATDFHRLLDSLARGAGRGFRSPPHFHRTSVLDLFSLLQSEMAGAENDVIFTEDNLTAPAQPGEDLSTVELKLPLDKLVRNSAASAASTAGAASMPPISRAAVWRATETGMPPLPRLSSPLVQNVTQAPDAKSAADPPSQPLSYPLFEQPSTTPRKLAPSPPPPVSALPSSVSAEDMTKLVLQEGPKTEGGPGLVREMSVEATLIRLPTPRRLGHGLVGDSDSAPVWEIGSTQLCYPSPRLQTPFAGGGGGHTNGPPEPGRWRLYDSEFTPSYGPRLPLPSESPRPDAPPVVPSRNAIGTRRLEFSGPPQTRWPRPPAFAAAPAALGD